jgi:hypothetical protein
MKNKTRLENTSMCKRRVRRNIMIFLRFSFPFFFLSFRSLFLVQYSPCTRSLVFFGLVCVRYDLPTHSVHQIHSNLWVEAPRFLAA